MYDIFNESLLIQYQWNIISDVTTNNITMTEEPSLYKFSYTAVFKLLAYLPH